MTMLKMMLKEEENTDKNKEMANNVLQWFAKYETKKEDNDGADFMKLEYSTPGSSGESDVDVKKSQFYVPTPKPIKEVNEENITKDFENANINAEEPLYENADVVNKEYKKIPEKTQQQQNTNTPVMRRKDKGPRVTRNMTETEVFDQLRQLCSEGRPEDKYEMGKELGAGAGGTVHLAISKETNDKVEKNQQVAIKIIDMAKQPKKEMILMEIKVMKDLNHPNLVNFVEAFLIGCNLWVVMEYMSGGALTDVVTETILKEGQIACICHEVLQGLAYLHDRGILHRDIKSDNVLLDLGGKVKITDFGYCANAEVQRHTMVRFLSWLKSSELN